MPDELIDDTAAVSDETAQAAVEPTATPADDIPWAAEEYDRERAYRTLQAVRTEAKEFKEQAKQYERLRNDPSAFREFVTELGYEIPEDEDEIEPDEPQAAELRDPRVDALLAEREQEKRNQQVMDQAAKDVADIQKELGRELSPKELEKLGKLALPDDNGIPRVSLAWAELKDWGQASNKVAAPPPSGVQGSEKFDIRDEDQRLARMKAIIEAGSA